MRCSEVLRNVSRLVSTGALLSAIAFGAGCAGKSATTPLTPPMGSDQTTSIQDQAELLSPDACGKKSTQDLAAGGGSLTLPTCSGYKGKVSYGKNNAPAKTTVTLITTTKNPGNVPTPAGKTVLAFVQATGNSTGGSVTFNNTSSKSTISNKKLLSSKTYALYAYALGILVSGFPQQIGSPVNGVLTFASPLNGQTVPQGITIDFELAQN